MEQKGWIDRILDPHCDFELWPHPWPWPLIFKDEFWKSCNSRMGCPIDLKKGMWVYWMLDLMLLLPTLTLPMALTLNFQCQILKMLYLRNGRADWHVTKEMWVDRILDSHCEFELWPHPWPWPWIFKLYFWNSCISGTGEPINMEQKGYESIRFCTYCVTLSYDFDLGFWRSDFMKALSSE